MITQLEPGAPHDGRKFGQGTHRVIGALLARGLRAPSATQILETVARDPALQLPNLTYRLAARQVLASATAIYFRLFVPGGEWSFVEAEVPVPGAQLDLLFEDAAGELRADELKTGRMPALTDPRRLYKQVAAELAGGCEEFGERFGGVRVLVLGAPLRSYTVDRHGVATGLTGR